MGVLLTQKLNLKVVFRRAQTASLAVPPMSGSPTFNTGKKPRIAQFTTPPRPTGRRGNKAKFLALLIQN